MWEPKDLLDNVSRLHTTSLGVARVRSNLGLNNSVDVVDFCRNKILTKYRSIVKRGKNWYVYIEDFYLTINANSYTIITAHKIP